MSVHTVHLGFDDSKAMSFINAVDLKGIMVTLAVAVEKNSADTQRLTEGISGIETSVSDVRTLLEEMQAQVHDVQRQQKDHRTRNESKLEEFEGRLTTTDKKLQETEERILAKITDVQRELTDAAGQQGGNYLAITESLTKLLGKEEDIDDALAGLRKEFEASDATHGKAEADLSSRIESLAGTLSNLSENLSHIPTTAEGEGEVSSVTEGKIRALETKIKATATDVASVQEGMGEVKKELRNIRKVKVDDISLKEQLETPVLHLTGRINDLRSSVDERIAELLQKIEEQPAAAPATNDPAVAGIDSEALDELKSHVETITGRVDQLLQQGNNRSTEIATLKIDLKQLATEVERLEERTQDDSTSKRLSDLERFSADAGAKVSNHERLLDEARKKLERVRMKGDPDEEMITQVLNINTSIQEINVLVADLTQSLNIMRSTVDDKATFVDLKGKANANDLNSLSSHLDDVAEVWSTRVEDLRNTQKSSLEDFMTMVKSRLENIALEANNQHEVICGWCLS